MDKAWEVPRVGHDLAYMLCDYIRETGHLHILLKQFVAPTDDGNPAVSDEVGVYILHLKNSTHLFKLQVRLAAGQALENIMSAANRDFIARAENLEPVMRTCVQDMKEGDEKVRTAISLMESMFKNSPETRYDWKDEYYFYPFFPPVQK